MIQLGYDMRIVDKAGEGIYPDGFLTDDGHYLGEHDRSVPDRHYFRLNISGMVDWRDTLLRIGMLDWKVEPEPFIHLSEEASEAYREEDWPESEYADEIDAMEEASRRIVNADAGSVLPGYKFCSNDGWLVTPAEIDRALTVYSDWVSLYGVDALMDELPHWTGDRRYERDLWYEWVAFLKLARENGGFRVW